MPDTLLSKSPFVLRNIRLFVLFRLFFYSRFYYPIFTVLLLDFGLTLHQFSILNTVWAVSIVLLEVPSGVFADLWGRRVLLMVAGALNVTETVLLCFAPLGNMQCLFWMLLLSRICSGIAEAAASGSDEALAYDTLLQHHAAKGWGQILEFQIAMQSLGVVVASTVGAVLYDPDFMEVVGGWMGFDWSLSQADTMRLPLYLSLVVALLACCAAWRMEEVTLSASDARRPRGDDQDSSGRSP